MADFLKSIHHMNEEDFGWQRNAEVDSGVLEYVAFHTDEGLQIREAVVRKPGSDVVWRGGVPYIPRQKDNGTWEEICELGD